MMQNLVTTTEAMEQVLEDAGSDELVLYKVYLKQPINVDTKILQKYKMGRQRFLIVTFRIL